MSALSGQNAAVKCMIIELGFKIVDFPSIGAASWYWHLILRVVLPHWVDHESSQNVNQVGPVLQRDVFIRLARPGPWGGGRVSTLLVSQWHCD